MSTGVEQAERIQHALELAYRHVARRDRTVSEVRWHLERHEVPPPAIDAAIDELATQGYLDDARYAQRFAQDRRELDAWGAERIARRLLALGVARELVAAALAERDGTEELEVAVSVLRRRFPQPPREPRDRERALGILARKGFELDLAYEAIRAVGRADA